MSYWILCQAGYAEMSEQGEGVMQTAQLSFSVACSVSPFRKISHFTPCCSQRYDENLFFFLMGERGGDPEHTGLSFYTKMEIKVLVGGCYTDHKKVRKKHCVLEHAHFQKN